MSSVTYTNTGQSTPTGGGALDPSVSPIPLGGIRGIAAFATAIAQLNALQENLSTATNYYNINKQDFDFWNTTYNPKMLVALNEGMTRPFYTNSNFTPQYGALDYTASVGRGQSRASLKTDKEWFQTRRRIGKYNVGQGHRIDLKYALARLNSEFEGWNLGFRYEDNRKMVYDEQRHAHQAEILNLGIGAGNAARAGLATAVQGLSEAKTQRAGTLGSLSNGLSTFAGYAQQTQDIKQTARAKRAFAGSQTGGQLSTAAPKDKIFDSGF